MSARVLRRLACEAEIVLIATSDGSPLDIGRRSRQPTVAQRRALLVRDRTCRFPGCQTTRHLHAHHMFHWADGGPTDLANLVTICSFHHRFVHDHDWQINPAAAGTFRFAPPAQPPLPTARPLPAATPETNNPDLADLVRLDDRELRPLRPTAYWPPNNLDLDLAISVLHQVLDAIARDTMQPLAA